MTPLAARTIDPAHESHYAFERGSPTAETVRQADDDADLNRAIQAYKFFFGSWKPADFETVNKPARTSA